MEIESYTEIAGLEFEALTTNSAAMKLRQIAAGALYYDEIISDATGMPIGKNRKWKKIHDIKTMATRDLLESLQGQPLLVAYYFRHDLDRLLDEFGKDTPYLGHGVSAKDSKRIIEKWNAGQIPLLLGQPASMSHGLNMQGVGAHILWYTLTYNLEHYDQLIRRVWRQGQKMKVFIHHLIMKDTIEEKVGKALVKKDITQKKLLNALKERFV